MDADSSIPYQLCDLVRHITLLHLLGELNEVAYEALSPVQCTQ